MRHDKDLESFHAMVREAIGELMNHREKKILAMTRPRKKWMPRWLWQKLLRVILRLEVTPLDTVVDKQKDNVLITLEEKVRITINPKARYFPGWAWNKLVTGLINLKELP